MDSNAYWDRIDREDSVKFYREYFGDERELTEFLNRVYWMDWDNRIPRRMINQIRRFVTLAVRIDEIYPPRDGLRLVFIRTCMESLHHLGKSASKTDFFREFEECFDKEGVRYIQSHFKLVSCFLENEPEKEIKKDVLAIGDFLNLIKYIRNQTVHEGIFWDIQVFAGDKDSQWMTNIETNERIFDGINENEQKEMYDYHFETTMQFDRFIYYFTKACINFVNRYINKKYIS